MRAANPVGPGLQQGPGLNGVPSRQGIDANWNKRYWVGSAYLRNGVGLRLPGESVTARTNCATMVDAAALRPTGDMELVVKATASSWTPAAGSVIAHCGNNSTASTVNWYLSMSTSGVLNFVRPTGSTSRTYTSTVPVGLPPKSASWIKATFDQDNGAAASEVRFYLSDDGVTWTQLGAAVTAVIGAGNSDTSGLTFGNAHVTAVGFLGRLHRVILRSSIGGPDVLDANFDSQATGATSFAESVSGRTVTITSAAQTWGTTTGGMWSEESGGVGGASTPSLAGGTRASDVYFDANSGPVACTLGSSNYCRSLDMTGFTGSMTWVSSAHIIDVGGSSGGGHLTMSPTATYSYANATVGFQFYSTSPDTAEIRTNGVTMPWMIFSGVGGSWKLMDDCVPRLAGTSFTLSAGGTVDTNGFTMGTKLLPWNMALAGTSSRRVLKLGSSTVWCSSWAAGTAGLDIDPGTSTINVVGTGASFAAYGGQRYNTVAFPTVTSTLATIGGLSHAGAGGTTEIAHLIVRSVAPSTYAGTTTNPTTQWSTGANAGSWRVTDLTMEGQPNYPLTAFGSGWGSAGSALQVANPPTLSNVTFVDFPAGGASVPWSGTRLGDGGNNTNITFPVSQTNYWVESTPGLTGSGLYCGTTNGSGSAGGSSRGTYATAPDSVPLSITGDIDLRVKFSGRITRETTGTNRYLITKGNTPGGATRAYHLRIGYTGYPYLAVSLNGTTDTVIAATETAWPLSNYTAGWLRATRVASTGVVTFYTSPDGSTWAQLGTAVTGATGAINDSPSPLWIGCGESGTTNNVAFDGTLLRAQVYNGIAGTLAFDADFETAPAAALSFTESSVNAATVTVVPFAATSNGAHSDAAHWASSTGGASGSGRVPLAHDDVVYDGNSGTGRPQWDTNDVGRNVTGTGATVGIIDLFPRYIVGGAASQSRIFGSLTVGTLTGVTWTTGASSLEFCGRGATFTHSIGSAFGWGDASTSLVTALRFYPLPSTTHALGSNLNTAWAITPSTTLGTGGGTFDAAGYDVTCYSFTDALTTQVRTVNFGSGTWTLTGTSGTVLSIPNQANLTLAGNPSWVISESLDARVVGGKWRVPQYGSDPSNTTRATNYVAGDAINGSNTWQTPRPATALTDDLDIIVRFNRDFTTQIAPLLHTWNLIPTPGISFVSYVSATNVPVLQMSTNGTTAASTATCTAPLPFGGGTTGWLRVTRTKTTGEVRFYTCADQVTVPSGGDWVQLGATISTLLTSSLYAGKTDLAVGQSVGASALPRGLDVYHAQVSNVIDGAPVATLDFTSLSDYSLSTTDAQGNVWRSYQYASRTNHRVVGGTVTGMAPVASSGWGSPDSAALSITGDIDLQFRVRPWSNTYGILTQKGGASGTDFSWLVGLSSLTGRISLALAPTISTSFGADSSAAMSEAPGTWRWVRATWRQSDGRVQFFTAPDADVPVWVQLGTDRTIAIASIWDTSRPLHLLVGNSGLSNPIAADLAQVRIFNGIEGSGGTLAFDADFTGLQDDTYAFRESSVNSAVVYASAHGTSGPPAGRTSKQFYVNKTLPGSSVTIQPGGGGLLVIGRTAGGAAVVLPPLISQGGKWLIAIDSTAGVTTYQSITWTTDPTGPRNALVRPLANYTRWKSDGLVTVNYADVLYNDADGASIPFSNVNGYNYGTTDWIDENIYPDYIILGMQD